MATNETTYKNPWHDPKDSSYGPAFYKTDAEPVEYGGYLIYQRWDRYADVYDVVKDEVCVTQMAGPNGARQAIDKLNAQVDEEPEAPCFGR